MKMKSSIESLRLVLIEKREAYRQLCAWYGGEQNVPEAIRQGAADREREINKEIAELQVSLFALPFESDT